MENLEWVPFYYNGIETNVEVTKCGRVRRIKIDWIVTKSKIGEVDFNQLKTTFFGYKSLGVQIKGLNSRTIGVHQLVASAFLDYKFQGHKFVVDHIDSNKLNNHLDNLQVITQRENTSREKTIKSGLPTGVNLNKISNRYVSSITINNKLNYLGTFSTPEEASNAYQQRLKTI